MSQDILGCLEWQARQTNYAIVTSSLGDVLHPSALLPATLMGTLALRDVDTDFSFEVVVAIDTTEKFWAGATVHFFRATVRYKLQDGCLSEEFSCNLHLDTAEPSKDTDSIGRLQTII